DVTANAQSKTYGNTLALGTTAFATGSGQLVNGDTVTAATLTAAQAADATAAAGTYAIVASAAVFGSGTAANYAIADRDGVLTVNARALDVTANARSKTYGDTLTLGTTAFATGSGQLVNGDTVTAATLTAAQAADATAAAGTYPIVASAAVFGSGTA